MTCLNSTKFNQMAASHLISQPQPYIRKEYKLGTYHFLGQIFQLICSITVRCRSLKWHTINTDIFKITKQTRTNKLETSLTRELQTHFQLEQTNSRVRDVFTLRPHVFSTDNRTT